MQDRKRDGHMLNKVYLIMLAISVLLVIPLCSGTSIEKYRPAKYQDRNKIEGFRRSVVEDPTAPVGKKIIYMGKLDPESALKRDLIFYACHSNIRVTIDGSLVYLLERKAGMLKTPGNAWVDIPLVGEVTDGYVKVEMTPVYRDVVSLVPTFYLDNRDTHMREVLIQEVPQIILSLATFFIGIGYLIYYLVQRKNQKSNGGVGYLGLFSILISLWKLSGTWSYLIFFSKYSYLATYVSMIALLLMPGTFIVYLRENLNNQKIRQYYNKVLSCVLSIDGIILALQILQIIDLRQAIVIIDLMVLVAALLLLFQIIYKMTHRERESTALVSILISFLMFTGVIIDFIIYLKFRTDSTSFTIFFVVIYIAFSGLGSIINLSKEANYDLATEVYNKSRCIALLDQWTPDNENVGLVLYDLNDLKKINDHFGHEAGDQTIRRFAKILKNNFPRTCFIGRYGGDEFIIQIPSSEISNLDQLIKNVEREEKSVNIANVTQEGYYFSSSWGYAIAKADEDISYQELFKKADQMMYANKRVYHATGAR